MFTDIEGSTRLWELHPFDMGENIRCHDAIVDRLIADHGGQVVDHAGDGAFAVFESGDPLRCSIAIQQTLQEQTWKGIDELRVRIAVHAGERPTDAADYRGLLANRTARILATGWGGQILVTPEAVDAFPIPEDAKLKELGEHLLRDLAAPQPILDLGHPSLELRSFPSLRSLSGHANNLTPQPNLFVGREEELVRLSRLLEEPQHRLLTITGPGGMGKTRLAIQSAGELTERFPSGVYFVPLASLESPDLVISAIAAVLRFNLYSKEEPRAQLARYLGSKTMLLILDNFEHLMAAADQVLFLLREAVNLKIVLTSRERLDVQGEVVFSLGGLRRSRDLWSAEGSDAYRLFIERARLVDSDHVWSDEEKAQIVRLCHLVEGAPLAIELAAAWVHLLSCEEIADEIEESIDFLSTSQRDISERHRNLRAVFDYSLRLTSDEEETAFRRLSVFKGGFDHRAARRVAGVDLHRLRSLINKSLLAHSADTFSVHELLRQFGEERLREHPDEYDRIRRHHCEHYTAFLRQQRTALRGDGLEAATSRVKGALENIRSAWRWALEQGYLEALDSCLEDVIVFFETQSRSREGAAFFDAIVSHFSASPAVPVGAVATRLLGMALAARGLFRLYLARYEAALEDTERALGLLRAQGFAMETGYCLYIQASAKQVTGNYEESEKLFRESIAVLDEVGDHYRAIHSRIAYAQLHAWLGRIDEARKLYVRCIAECRDVWARTICQCLLGELDLEHGHRGAARQSIEEGLAVLRRLGDRRWIVRCLTALARIAFQEGEHDTSHHLAEEGVAITEEIRDLRMRADCLILLGRLEAQGAAPEAARGLFVQVLEISRESQDTPLVLETVLRLVETGLVDDPARGLGLVELVAAHPACRQSTLHDARILESRLRGATQGGARLTADDLDSVVDEILRPTDVRLLQEA